MSQTSTRNARPKILDPQKKLQVVFSISQLEKALEESNDKLEPDEVRSIIDEEKQRIQEVINQMRAKEKEKSSQKQSTGNDSSVSSSTSKDKDNSNTNPHAGSATSSGGSSCAGGLGGSSGSLSGATASSILVPPVEICPLNVPKLIAFQRPEHYIRFPVHKEFVSGIRLEDGTVVHYNMVKVDEEFLQSLYEHMKVGVSESDFIKMIDFMEKSTGRGSEISFDEALQICRERGLSSIKNQQALLIYKYWRMRRHKLGKPLLRHFWPITSPHDSSPYACFRPRVREKMTLRRPRRNNKETLEKLEKLLDDFRKVEKSFRKLRQRDEKKLLLAELDTCIFDQRRHEITDPFYRCPIWDRLKNYKQQKRQHKKEMRGVSQFSIGTGAGGSIAQLFTGCGVMGLTAGSPLFIQGGDFSSSFNPGDLSMFIKKLSSEIGNLDMLLKYSWENETSLLSYYYYGSLQLTSSIFNVFRTYAGKQGHTEAIKNGENTDQSFSVMSDGNKGEIIMAQTPGHSSNIEPTKLNEDCQQSQENQAQSGPSPAFCRIAIPNYIQSIYKNGVDLARLEPLQSLRTPCRPHRLVRRRGRGGRIWFDRHLLFQDNFEPHFTDPDKLDLASNCGGSNQFIISSYFRKTASMCDLIDELCTEGNFDPFGNSSNGNNTQGISVSISSSSNNTGIHHSSMNDLPKSTIRLSGTMNNPNSNLGAASMPINPVIGVNNTNSAAGFSTGNQNPTNRSIPRNASYLDAEMTC
ncbi:Enhancer of polycomb-like protein [Cryptosporidium tyzzeri]|nr:Enhancer of polycomb-like protein [Cryptosporidium tyzzeri]